ncbi:MAG: CBS domain-containing protein [Rhizobiaceae bacterium]|nr:CBS domain-containing protein [Rhizobiaceae bacterium]
MLVTGATPLAMLDAVALDTETTGLDARTDRIVQIGLVALERGRLAPQSVWERLVDPCVPVPAQSTAIHHITNAMVRQAPRFAEAWREAQTHIRGRILIGYSIGFDLAVLANEAERAGIDWQKPRSLCVRLLAATANPHLPDYSLEALASWLGVKVTSRHQALGDARAAAEIFIAMVPRLAERGIRTLAEAERGCLQLTEQLETHVRAGWSEPVTRPEAIRSFIAVDPYAYRHRVGELMSAPPVIVRADVPVREAMALMQRRKISSLFVSETGEAGRPGPSYAIATERDVMRHISALGAEALDNRVGDIATRPLVCIRDKAFAYRAIGRMDRLKIRHLAVKDDAGILVGIVSARDLLKLRASAAINLSDRIEDAANAQELAAAWSQLPGVATSLIAEGIDAVTIAEIVSEELRAVTRRSAVLAEGQMLADGLGAPPCAYSVVVLGSGGRGESLLAADQDNAIVFAEGEPGGGNDVWFAALGERLAPLLDEAGIPLCKGGVMAKNPQWRGSLETWRHRISDWVRRSRPEDLLNVDIFYDLSPVHGDRDLALDLLDSAYEAAHGQITFAKALGETAARPVTAFTMLGGFRTEQGRIDLKMHGLFPVVAFARALAIRHGVRERSTRERLTALRTLDIGGDAEFQRLINAHGKVVKFMLAQQARDMLAGVPVSNKVEIAALSPDEQAELKQALRVIQLVPELVRHLMFG